MRNLLRTVITAVLVLGIALAIWRMNGGDIGGFLDGIGSLLYQAIDAVGTFFENVFGAFFGGK